MYFIESKMKFCAVLIVASITTLHSTFAQDVTDKYCDKTLCRNGATHIGCNNNGVSFRLQEFQNNVYGSSKKLVAFSNRYY